MSEQTYLPMTNYSLTERLILTVIHGITGNANKSKISPCKRKKPNVEVLDYIKGGKYPEAEFSKYIYAIKEVQLG